MVGAERAGAFNIFFIWPCCDCERGKPGDNRGTYSKSGVVNGQGLSIWGPAKIAQTYWDHIPQEEFDDGFEIPKKDHPDFVHEDIAKQIRALKAGEAK